MAEQVELIEYSKKVELSNFLTHAIGAVLSAFAMAAGIIKAAESGEPRHIASAIIYGISLVAVYTVSAVYHGLPMGEQKRRARRADHTTVPLLIAGTATPCALITLYNIAVWRCALVFALAWFCFAFGAVVKLFFFSKFKATTMAVYIVGGMIMLGSAVPVIGSIDSKAFFLLILGSTAYLIGACLCGIGRKYQSMHAVFHVFVLLGSAIHYYVIYSYVL